MKSVQRLIFSCKARFAYKKPNKPWYDPKMNVTSRQKSSHLHFAMFGIMFAGCFAAIPLYRIFCEHMGLVGNLDKKQYDFKGKKITNVRKYQVNFTGEPQPGINWQFTPMQPEVHVNAAETAIVFYKIYNKEDYPIIGFSTYNVTPELANVYFSKIQCFCFNQQLINPKQELLLPLFFYLEPEINEDPNVSRINEITVDYRFFKSDKQDLAKHVERELRQLQLNRKALTKIRAEKAGMTLEKYMQVHGDQETATEARLHEMLETAKQESEMPIIVPTTQTQRAPAQS